MKKIIWIILALAVGAYFVNSYLENEAKRELVEVEQKRIWQATQQATKLAVAQMVSRTSAVSDWTSQLSKGKRLTGPSILTIDLERVWLQSHPILFIGTIVDIATLDQLNYTVSVKYPLGLDNYLFYRNLELSLTAEKERIDSFIKKHPNLFKGGVLREGVAIVARVNSIRTVHIAREKGGTRVVKVGEGELIDIVYTGTVVMWRNFLEE